jgi:hypothetical protein
MAPLHGMTRLAVAYLDNLTVIDAVTQAIIFTFSMGQKILFLKWFPGTLHDEVLKSFTATSTDQAVALTKIDSIMLASTDDGVLKLIGFPGGHTVSSWRLSATTPGKDSQPPISSLSVSVISQLSPELRALVETYPTTLHLKSASFSPDGLLLAVAGECDEVMKIAHISVR